MENKRLLGIRRMDRVQNTRIRELCRVKKDLDERIDEGVLQWFVHLGLHPSSENVYLYSPNSRSLLLLP